ncbi:MAG: DHH family phosphoesterase [Candidatus Hadarchaeum sp.]|uniref:DHH family phosphoesterase n=1 Tax=Candidatus Hadarchaeum sp. TaxID=2883567 RepID=UPI00316D3866
MKDVADFLTQAVRSGQRIVILCHRNADPDAVASAVVLAEVMSSLGAQVKAATADDLAAISEVVLNSFNRKVEVNPELDFDLAIFVDTSSFGHLGEFGKKLRDSGIAFAVIDHHRPVEEMRQLAKFYYVREDITSESELIYRILVEMGLKLTPEQATLLLVGVISDTGHFRFASPETFTVVEGLLKAGADYNRALELLKPPDDLSRRVAMLKAAGRSELQRINGRLIVFSDLGSFEGDAAGMLVRIGADVAFVGSEEKGEFRVSGRASPEFLKETGIHLGEMMEELGKQFNGSGGGHAGAASVSGKGSFEEVKKQIVKMLQRRLFKAG